MDYKSLSVHEKINLKATYAAFLKIAVERFRKEQDKRIYKKRTRKRRGGRMVSGAPRTKQLYNSFSTSYTSGLSGADHLRIEFLMYGRFIDMGVGRGTSVNYALVRKRFGARRTGIARRPIRWYSKRRKAEEHRLREVLEKIYGKTLIQLAEAGLNQVVTIPLS